jgi:hypothetical protein
MTIGRLHKVLTRMIENGHGRKPIYVHKGTFTHPLEADGAVILEVRSVSMEWVLMADDDGGTKLNQSGTEAGKTCLVLSGDTVYQ